MEPDQVQPLQVRIDLDLMVMNPKLSRDSELEPHH